MIRATIVLLAGALGLAAQQGMPVLVDAVVVDAAGKPVTGLNASDFAITPAAAVEHVSFFDTVRHIAVTPGAIPAIDLTPDQIHRTLVFVVDDLCVAPESVRGLRRQLHDAVAAILETGGQAAVLRTSGGTARSRQLAQDVRLLTAAIEEINFLGGGVQRGACASAAWTTVAHAVSGLRAVEGRKAVVLVSGDLSGPTGSAGPEIARLAAQSMTAVYETASPAPALAESTGGEAGLDLPGVLQREASYYVLGFHAPQGETLRVELRRPGATLRARTRAAGRPLRSPFPAPGAPEHLADEAMNSPFEAHEIDVRLTPLYATSVQGGPMLEVLLHIDIRELNSTRDAKGRYRLGFDVALAAFNGPTPSTRSVFRPYAVELTEEEYRRAREEGAILRIPLKIPFAGAGQIRAVVSDMGSGRRGSASAFVDGPDLAHGRFGVSGILLEGDTAGREGPAVRVFRPGQKLGFGYAVFNAATDKEGASQIQTQTTIYAGGRMVVRGSLAALSFPKSEDPGRHIVGTVTLDANAGPGRYVLCVTATDKLSEKPVSAIQYIDFTIE